MASPFRSAVTACLLTVAVGACSSSSSPAASSDGGGGGVEAGCEWACPSGDDGGVCTCDDASAPACPASASEAAPCDVGAGCTGCSQGAGFFCNCVAEGGVPDVDGGGPRWFCVGSEHACTGGTF